MTRQQIKVGGKYRMRVSGEIVTVRVDSIQTAPTVYICTNLSTGRDCRAYAASKFREKVD